MGSEIIEKLKETYNQMGKENLDLLGRVYSDNVIFQDPFHRIDGLANLKRYFENMYSKLNSIQFDYLSVIKSDNSAVLTWKMTFSHQSIKKGRAISIAGATHLKFDEKIFYHYDYFDSSAMLFEHLPIIGTMLKWIRKQV